MKLIGQNRSRNLVMIGLLTAMPITLAGCGSEPTQVEIDENMDRTAIEEQAAAEESFDPSQKAP